MLPRFIGTHVQRLFDRRTVDHHGAVGRLPGDPNRVPNRPPNRRNRTSRLCRYEHLASCDPGPYYKPDLAQPDRRPYRARGVILV